MNQVVRLTFKQFKKYYRVRLFDEEWDLDCIHGVERGYFGHSRYVITCAKWNIDRLYDWFKRYSIPPPRYRECIQEAVNTSDYYLTIVVSDDSTKRRTQHIVQTVDRYIIEFGILDRLKYRVWLWTNKKAEEDIQEDKCTAQFLRSVQKDIDFHLKMSKSYVDKCTDIMNDVQKEERREPL